MQLDEAVKIFPEMSISLTRYPPVFDQYYGDVLLFFLRKVHLPDARPPVFDLYSGEVFMQLGEVVRMISQNVQVVDPNLCGLDQCLEETFCFATGEMFFSLNVPLQNKGASRKAIALAFLLAYPFKSAACRLWVSHVPDYSPST